MTEAMRRSHSRVPDGSDDRAGPSASGKLCCMTRRGIGSQAAGGHWAFRGWRPWEAGSVEAAGGQGLGTGRGRPGQWRPREARGLGQAVGGLVSGGRGRPVIREAAGGQ